MRSVATLACVVVRVCWSLETVWPSLAQASTPSPSAARGRAARGALGGVGAGAVDSLLGPGGVEARLKLGQRLRVGGQGGARALEHRLIAGDGLLSLHDRRGRRAGRDDHGRRSGVGQGGADLGLLGERLPADAGDPGGEGVVEAAARRPAAAERVGHDQHDGRDHGGEQHDQHERPAREPRAAGAHRDRRDDRVVSRRHGTGSRTSRMRDAPALTGPGDHRTGSAPGADTDGSVRARGRRGVSGSVIARSIGLGSSTKAEVSKAALKMV